MRIGAADAQGMHVLRLAGGLCALLTALIVVAPGAAIFLTILSYNMVGEALRDAIDPKLKKARV